MSKNKAEFQGGSDISSGESHKRGSEERCSERWLSQWNSCYASHGDPWKGSASICTCEVSAQSHSSIQEGSRVLSNYPEELYPCVPSIDS